MENVYIFILKKRISVRLRQKKYRKILKTFNSQWADRKPSSIYRNFIRVICLHEAGDPIWKAEYGHILNTEQLKLLGVNDANYLRHFFYKWIEGSENPEFRDPGFILSQVSQTTKQLFPLEMIHEKLASLEGSLHISRKET